MNPYAKKAWSVGGYGPDLRARVYNKGIQQGYTARVYNKGLPTRVGGYPVGRLVQLVSCVAPV